MIVLRIVDEDLTLITITYSLQRTNLQKINLAIRCASAYVRMIGCSLADDSMFHVFDTKKTSKALVIQTVSPV